MNVEKEKFLKESESYGKDSPITPEDSMKERQTSEKVLTVLDQLSVQDRALVLLRYREGFSDSEISVTTNMPVGTVKTRLHRARSRLKGLLRPLLPELDSMEAS